MSDLLTLDEASRRLRVSVKTIGRLIDAGRLAIVRVGDRRKLIAASEIDRYIADNTCRFASTETAGGSASAWEAADALSAAFRSAQPEPTRRRSRLASGRNSSRLQLVE